MLRGKAEVNAKPSGFVSSLWEGAYNVEVRQKPPS